MRCHQSCDCRNLENMDHIPCTNQLSAQPHSETKSASVSKLLFYALKWNGIYIKQTIVKRQIGRYAFYTIYSIIYLWLREARGSMQADFAKVYWICDIKKWPSLAHKEPGVYRVIKHKYLLKSRVIEGVQTREDYLITQSTKNCPPLP